MKGRPWTPEEDAAIFGRTRYGDARKVAEELGRSKLAVSARKKYLRNLNRDRSQRNIRRSLNRRAAMQIVVRPAEPPDLRALADRDHRANLVPTINQMILGDPLPGRSALDRRTSPYSHSPMRASGGDAAQTMEATR